ncbi:MAG: hypothetical protein IT518_10915 [Burkholderiales bacterium]|nr:hypothetical protein [Burkholderiales bacterium]
MVLDRPEDLDYGALLRPGDAVVCSQGLAEPIALTTQLVQQRAKVGRCSLMVGPSYSTTFAPEHGDAIAFRSYCATASNGPLVAAGVLDILPCHYGDLAPMYADGTLRCDVALLFLNGPDAQGRYNAGFANDYVLQAARHARLVIVELSDRIPWAFGAELPPDIQPHVAVRTNREPLTLDYGSIPEAPVEQRIAERVAALVPDEATIETGIGLLPELILRALRGKRDLGVHSAVFGDGMSELMRLGVVTNARKPVDRGVSVCGIMVGSRRLFDFVHRNPQIRFATTAFTHGIRALSALPNFVAINGALEVDLTGQVNGETIAGRYVGAVGGQVDLVRGAKASPGGRSIIALPSTSRDGKASRIVPILADRVVTTARCEQDVVVTEHGAAFLRGKSLRERAKALAAIAHPAFREELEHAAHSLPGLALPWNTV